MSAQKGSFSLSGGVSNSAIPLYTKTQEAVVLSRLAVNNLSFAGSYNHKYSKHFSLITELSYNRLGGNSVFRISGQSGFFVHNASLNYISAAVLPQFDLEIGKYTLSANLGPSVSYLLKERLINFQFEGNEEIGREQEPSDLENLDYGVNGTVQLSRLVANNFKVLLSVRQYQGLTNIGSDDQFDSIYIGNTVLYLGLNIPLRK